MTERSGEEGARELATDSSVGQLTGGGAVICGRLEFARSFWERFRGLMGRSALDDDAGLYLPGNSIHMFFMRFPIDAVFLSPAAASGERTIVACRPGLRPWLGLVLPVKGADGVVELPDGAIGRTGIQVGDKLRVEEAAA